MTKNIEKNFTAPEENYQILHGDVQAVRERSGVWDTDYVLSKYVSCTDAIVGALDGSIAERDLIDPDNPERSEQKPDTVIWLDKSARPVSWLTDAFWEQFAHPDEKMPDFEYLNIDRVDWFKKQGYRPDEAASRLTPQDFDIDKVPEEDIARIRAIFTIGEIDENNWQKHVWELPTRLDGKNILIVDEVKNKGGTLYIAQQLLKRAFPDATVSGQYFWQSGRYALGGNPDEMQMESAPVWYDSKDTYGRGVGDISHRYYNNLPDSPENFKKKLGWIALSAPHFNLETFEELEDVKAKRLLQDIAYATYDYASGNILRAPSPDREMDDYEAIAAQQGLSIAQLSNLRQARANKNSSRI